MSEKKLTPEEAFSRDIPEAEVDNVLTAISEAAHEGKGTHGIVTILEQDRLDAINVRASGTVLLDGKEYSFIVSDGDRNGTDLESWEESGTQDFKPFERTQWALAPNQAEISKAIASKKGAFLIAKWDALLSQSEVSRIPSNYAYDRMMQPGIVVERHYKETAAKRGFVLTDQEDADSVRRRLLEAS